MLPVLNVSGLNKSFVMHAQGDLALPVLQNVELDVLPGECLALVGPSGAGKSTLLRSLYGNYRPQSGSIQVRHREDWVEFVGAEPRVIPRVGAVDVVAEPMVRRGASLEEARRKAEFLLGLLGIPQRLWALPPAT